MMYFQSSLRVVLMDPSVRKRWLPGKYTVSRFCCTTKMYTERRTRKPLAPRARGAIVCQAEANGLSRVHCEFMQDLPRLIDEANRRLVRTDREAGVP